MDPSNRPEVVVLPPKPASNEPGSKPRGVQKIDETPEEQRSPNVTQSLSEREAAEAQPSGQLDLYPKSHSDSSSGSAELDLMGAAIVQPGGLAAIESIS